MLRSSEPWDFCDKNGAGAEDDALLHRVLGLDRLESP